MTTPEARSRSRAAILRALAGAVAVAFVFGPAITGVLGVRETPIENRPMAPSPRLNEGWDAIDRVTPWAIDRLPGRSKAIEVKANLDYYGYGDLPGTQVAPGVGAAGAPVAGTGGTGDSGGNALTPTVVRGKDGFLYYGDDFVSACENSEKFAESVDQLAELGHTIEKSGRKVVVTVAPNKSSIVGGALPRAVPRGSCAEDGIAAENRVLDSFDDPLVVPLRAQLVGLQRKGMDAYWHTDTHWTSLGGSIWVRALADRLRPSLGDQIRVTPVKVTKVTDLMTLMGLRRTESADSVRVTTGAKVTAAEPTVRERDRRVVRWVSRPSSGLVGGTTVLVGDSFTGVILPNVQPLFAQGTFARVDSPAAEIIDHIVKADTVVIEIVQRNVVGSTVAKPSFRSDLAKALGVAP